MQRQLFTLCGVVAPPTACGGFCRYYDLADFRLAVADTWLRRRDGQWELKTATQPSPGEDKSGNACHVLTAPLQRRQELHDPRDIQQHMSPFGVPIDAPLDALVADGTLVVLAELESLRDTYTYEHSHLFCLFPMKC
jgi:hypothetical protein